MKTTPVQILIHVFKAAVRPIALGAVLLGMVGSPGRADAQTATNAPPDRLSYQGYLVDANGNPLAPTTPANYTVVFRIWTAASSGTRLWSEQQIVTVDKGNFSVVLGEGSQYLSEARPPLGTVLANSANASDRYIGINVTINGTPTEILPRLRLLPTPYAFLSTSARNLTAANGTSVVTHANNRVEVIGDLHSSGTISGTFSGNGSGITSLSATALPQHLAGTRTFGGPVGIGSSATPAELLQVGGFGLGDNYLMAATAGGNRFRTGIKLRHFNSGYGWTLESDERDSSFRIMSHLNDANGITRLFMNRFNGNVGLNTTTPGFPLTFPNSLGDKISLWGQSGNSFGFGIQGSLLQIHADISGSDIAFGYGSSAAMTERMRIKGNGNVGIGTSTPVTRLHVQGGSDLSLSGGGYAVFGALSSANLAIDNNEIQARFNGGVNTLNLNADGGFVQLGLNSLDSHFGINRAYGNVTAAIRAAPSDDYLLFIENSAGGNIFAFDTAGAAFKPGGGSWSALSDSRLKTVLGPFQYGLKEILELDPVRYHYREGNARKLDPNPRYNGFVAQDVQKVIPEAVTEDRDGYLQLSLDPIYLASINAIKELHQLIEEKNTRIAALEAQTAKLKSMEAQLASVKEQMSLQQQACAAWEARFRKLEEVLAAKTEDSPQQPTASARQ